MWVVGPHDQGADIHRASFCAAESGRVAVAQEYGIGVRTLRRWIRGQGLDIPSGTLSPKSQALLYRAFGPPPPP
jgi:transposase-like protein